MMRRIGVVAIIVGSLSASGSGCLSNGRDPSEAPEILSLLDFEDCPFLDRDGAPLPCNDESTRLEGVLVVGGNWLCVQSQQHPHVDVTIRKDIETQEAVLDWRIREERVAGGPGRIDAVVLWFHGAEQRLLSWNTTFYELSVRLGTWNDGDTLAMTFLRANLTFGGVLSENATWTPNWLDVTEYTHNIGWNGTDYHFSPYHRLDEREWVQDDAFLPMDVAGDNFLFRIDYDWVNTSLFWDDRPTQLVQCNL